MAAHLWATPVAAARCLRAALRRSSLDAWLRHHGARWSYHRGLAGERAMISTLRQLSRVSRGTLSPGVVVAGDPALGGGALLVFLHSPWLKAVARQLAAAHGVLAFGGHDWPARLADRHVPASIRGARRIHRHLCNDGLAAMSIDRFGEDAPCATRFLDFPVRVHTNAARLAALAGVPLVPMHLQYRGGLLHLPM